MNVLPGVVVDSLHEEAEIFKPNQPKQIKPCGVGEKLISERVANQSLIWRGHIPWFRANLSQTSAIPNPLLPKQVKRSIEAY